MPRRKQPRPELTLMVCSRCRHKATACTCTGSGTPVASESGSRADRPSLRAGAKNWHVMRVWTEDELLPVLDAMKLGRWQPAREQLEELLTPLPDRTETPRRAVSRRRDYQTGRFV